MSVASDFELPQLARSVEKADVLISKAEIPDTIPDAIVQNNFFMASKSELLFCIKGVGRYFISKGRNITAEPESKNNIQIFNSYLLGSSMGAILLQRGILPFHGSAVVINGSALIITGDSGAGKSSLAFAFRKRGYDFLTDDIAALKKADDGSIFVQPGYPQQKLWIDCIHNTGNDADNLTQICAGESKYYLPAVNRFCNTPVRLASICEIIPENSENIKLKTIDGVEKLGVLMNNVYRHQIAGFYGSLENYFRYFMDIANNVQVMRLFRPVDKFSVDDQAELLLQQLSQTN